MGARNAALVYKSFPTCALPPWHLKQYLSSPVQQMLRALQQASRGSRPQEAPPMECVPTLPGCCRIASVPAEGADFGLLRMRPRGAGGGTRVHAAYLESEESANTRRMGKPQGNENLIARQSQLGDSLILQDNQPWLHFRNWPRNC